MDGKLSVGQDLIAVANIQRSLATSLENFDFIVVPLVHPRFRREIDCGVQRDTPFTRSDMLFDSHTWNQRIIAKMSPWLDFDSPEATIRSTAEAVFNQEVGWASHLGCHALMLQSPRFDCANYARCIYQSLTKSTFLPFWIVVQMNAGEH